MKLAKFFTPLALIFLIGSFAQANTPQAHNKTSQQGTSEKDTELTRTIRENVMKADGMSTSAQNLRIATLNGRVTVSGAVKNQQEKNLVLDTARNKAGKTNVVDEIKIEPETY